MTEFPAMGALRHLNLNVADIDRSTAFYSRWFGFGQELARYPDGTVFLTDGEGFELALHAGPPAADAGWHFGFTCGSRDEVDALAAGLAGAGVELVDRHDEPGYVGFKCRDPDGYWIEVYFEPRAEPRA